jgi:hypothetical protein
MILVGRVLAGPGEAVATDGSRYRVNGTAGPGMYPVSGRFVVLVPPSPDWAIVPPGSYFVVQDNPRVGADTRQLSWVAAVDVLGTRVIRLHSPGFAGEAE